MAATVSSPWGNKPGAWALEAENAELEQQAEAPIMEPLTKDFPSLSAAAAVKPSKKKTKPQKVSLGEFHAGPKSVAPEPVGLTHEDRMLLPTGPRERSAEENTRGFRNYGTDRGVGRYPSTDESSTSRWGGSQRKEGFGKESDRDAPSRADEVDNWGAEKRSAAGSGFERRERGGFFGSQSKADESDSWVSTKPSEGRRKVGFASSGGADADTWGRRESNGGFERERKVGLGFSSNGGADSDSWGRKREEGGVSNGGSSDSITGRPRLNLQPRTLPVTLPPPPPPPVSSNETSPPAVVVIPRPRSSNPFGAARPREEVLAEKGQDWKKIDEQLESVKMKEKEAVAAEGESFGKRSFGMGNGRPGDRAERTWRKPEVADTRPHSAANSESRSTSEEAENENLEETESKDNVDEN